MPISSRGESAQGTSSSGESAQGISSSEECARVLLPQERKSSEWRKGICLWLWPEMWPSPTWKDWFSGEIYSPVLGLLPIPATIFQPGNIFRQCRCGFQNCGMSHKGALVKSTAKLFWNQWNWSLDRNYNSFSIPNYHQLHCPFQLILVSPVQKFWKEIQW